MRVVFTPEFKEELKAMPLVIQRKFYKQVHFLANDLRHPSLRAKKYSESEDIWQARVDRNMRFYFRAKKNCYILLSITKHSD